jgi:hypothetical protein
VTTALRAAQEGGEKHGDSKALRPPHPRDAQGNRERGRRGEEPRLDGGGTRRRRHERLPRAQAQLLAQERLRPQEGLREAENMRPRLQEEVLLMREDVRGGGVRGLRAPAVWAHASGAMGLQRLREAPDLPPGAVRLLGQDGAGQGRRAPRGIEAGPGHDRPRDGVPGPGGQGGARQGPVGPPRLRLQGRPPPLGALLLPPRRERGHRRG